MEAALRTELDAGADKKTAIAAVAGRLGVPKRHVYQIALVATLLPLGALGEIVGHQRIYLGGGRHG